jgi:carbon-monoxide dehydrogenase large subunit
MFAIESQMDTIAERLGIDPLEIRLKNVVEEGSISASNQKITHTALKECMLQAALVSNWNDRKDFSKEGGPIAKGKGLAIMHKGTFTPTSSSAIVRVNEDGSVTLLCATVDMGQGTETAYAQIAAEILGVPVCSIQVITSDTDMTPYDRSTTSSRSIFHMGNAVRLAALDAKKDLLGIASDYFESEPDDLVINQGVIFPKERASEGLTIAQLMRKHFNEAGTILGKGVFHTEGGQLDPNTSQGDIFSAFWMFACVVAEVEIDRETGVVRVVRIVSANDAGAPINPSLCKQQVEGGVIMGLGYTLSEELVFDKGRIVNGSFLDYNVPDFTSSTEIVPLLIGKPNPDGPFGAKGIAEESIVPVAPAIANAVYRATGVRIKSLPITSEKILNGLRKKRDQNDKGFGSI